MNGSGQPGNFRLSGSPPPPLMDVGRRGFSLGSRDGLKCGGQRGVLNSRVWTVTISTRIIRSSRIGSRWIWRRQQLGCGGRFHSGRRRRLCRRLRSRAVHLRLVNTTSVLSNEQGRCIGGDQSAGRYGGSRCNDHQCETPRHGLLSARVSRVAGRTSEGAEPEPEARGDPCLAISDIIGA